jgi:O-antigen/teichoic acid export membrane protein
MLAFGNSVIFRLRAAVRSRTDAVLRSVLKNGGWAAVGQFVSAGVSFVETIVLARYLSLNDFGILATLTSAAELVYGLLDFRAGEAVIKFVPELKSSRGDSGVAAFLKLILLLDASVSVVGFAIILVLGRLILGWSSLQNVYFSSLVVISFGLAARSVVRSIGAYFRICGRFDQLTMIGSITLLGRLALIVIVGVMIPTISALSWASAAANLFYMIVIALALQWVLRTNKLELQGSPIRLVSDMRRPMTAFLLSRNLEGTLRTLSTKLDTLVIAGLTSPGMVAIYKVAGRLAGSLMVFSDPLLVAVYPELSHLYASGRTKELRKLLRNMTLAFTALAVVAVGGFAIFGRWILHTLAGPQYDSAYPVVLLMFAGSVVSMIFFWARPLLLVRGHTHTLVTVAVVAFLAQLAGLYLLVPSLGAVGAGIAFAANYFVNIALFLFLIVRSRIGIPEVETKPT